MAVAREWFVKCNELGLERGQRIRYKYIGKYGKPYDTGEGIITMIYYGQEETLRVKHDDGTLVSVWPDMDTEIEILAQPEPDWDIEMTAERSNN